MNIIYKSYRFISAANNVKLVFYDDNCVFQNTTEDQRKLAIYDDISIKCLKCGNNDTYTRPGYSPDWRKYKGEDNNGEWDGKSFLCKNCYLKMYNALPDSHHSITKYGRKSRTNMLSVHSNTGKGFLAEAVVAKVRKLDVLSIKMGNITYKYDLSTDHEFKKIQVKSRVSYYGDWMIRFDLEEFDTLFLICMNKSGRKIERVYAIPEDMTYGVTSITIMGSGNSKYERYRIDETMYDAEYQSLILHLTGKEYFGIDDIVKWLSY